jgi:4'-phosphopantetheinyl transferase
MKAVGQTSDPFATASPFPAEIQLTGDELHVWRVLVHQPGPECLSILGKKEKERADRFKNEAARASFVSCRLALRKLLALYLGQAPESFALSCGQGIKPDFEERTEDLHFNLSHSGDYGLLAFRRGRGGAVGIDLEFMRDIDDWQALTKKVFSPREIESISHSPSSQDAFFACWTRKEAVVKALGTGIGRDFDSFSVSVNPGEKSPDIIWASPPDKKLQLQSFRWGNYLAAVASVGNLSSSDLHLYDWH